VADRLADGVISIACTQNAFAAVKEGGEVVTWGDAGFGGDSSSVADRLAGGVISATGNPCAFAAVKEGGEVVTWGLSYNGGDRALSLTALPMASFPSRPLNALLQVATWGEASCGGDSSIVADHIPSDVICITSTGSAFAACVGGKLTRNLPHLRPGSPIDE
jgi:alpha-tubulin suppressor-like RCC1 family protein